jgi:hypothetical protein
MILVLYSQHFIFFITYEWALEGMLFVTGEPFKPSVINHSSLLCLFVINEIKEVL